MRKSLTQSWRGGGKPTNASGTALNGAFMPGYIYQGNLGSGNIRRYAKRNWIDYCAAHWGNQWNSFGYDEFRAYEEGNNTVCFLTAVNEVRPVIKALSKKFPDTKFIYRWADEPISVSTGEEGYQNGETVVTFIPEIGSPEAKALAADIWQK